jgi:hypothetical protein
MTEVLGFEHIRVQVSAHLTRIFLLFGRLDPHQNVRYLPVTVHSILSMIKELELIEKKYYGFGEIVRENIECRDKFLYGFDIRPLLIHNPTVKGLRAALYGLTCPVIKAYCKAEREFLVFGPGGGSSIATRQTLLKRTKKNCEDLFAWCLPEESILLLELKTWCEEQMVSENAGA